MCMLDLFMDDVEVVSDDNLFPVLVYMCLELEANPDAMTVVVHTREDREALKLINLIQMVPALEAGMVVLIRFDRVH